MVFSWGNESFNEEWIAELVNELEPATLLMSKDKAEMMKNYCEKNGIEHYYHHYDGTLKSA